jgi:hypothetical protein
MKIVQTYLQSHPRAFLFASFETAVESQHSGWHLVSGIPDFFFVPSLSGPIISIGLAFAVLTCANSNGTLKFQDYAF